LRNLNGTRGCFWRRIYQSSRFNRWEHRKHAMLPQSIAPVRLRSSTPIRQSGIWKVLMVLLWKNYIAAVGPIDNDIGNRRVKAVSRL
jgi:hypothetical protein